MDKTKYVSLPYLLSFFILNLRPGCETDAAKKLKSKGPANFTSLVEDDIFVDKSLMIKDFIESKHDVVFLTFPRKWGKTVNMDMLHAFLQMEVDSKGKQMDNDESHFYKVFTNTWYASLKISKQKETLANHLQQHPVVHVTLKDVKGSSLEAIIPKIGEAIGKAFDSHSYMREILAQIANDPSASDVKKNNARHNKLLFEQIQTRSARDEDVLTRSVYLLSEILHEHFGKKVYILLDEYDRPVDFNLIKNAGDTDQVLDFMQSFMEDTFTDNKHFEKALVTGVMRVARLNHLPGITNAVEFDMLHNEFVNHYGFTETEVNIYFEFRKIKIADRISRELKRWYSGYNVRARADTLEDLTVYNPYCIHQFALHQNISNYWERTGEVDLFQNIFKLKDIESRFLRLLSGDSILVKLDYLSFSSEDLSVLKKSLENPKSDYNAVDLFFRYIFVAGYLTVDKKFEISEEEAHLKIPNREVYLEATRKLTSYYQETHNIQQNVWWNLKNKFMVLLRTNDKTLYQTTLESFFLLFPSFITSSILRSSVQVNEDTVHSALNMVLLAAEEACEWHSELYFRKWTEEKQPKPSRPSIILTSEELQVGVVLEIRYSSSAKEALEVSKKYAKSIKREDIKTIRCIGINVLPNRKVQIEQCYG